MLKRKIIFFLVLAFFIVSETESFQHGHKIVPIPMKSGSAYFMTGYVFAQTDYEDMNEDGITNNEADAYEMGTEETTDEAAEEDLSQAGMVEEQTNVAGENKGYVYSSSTLEQKGGKEKKEGISPWGLVQKIDDWIKKNLW